MAGGKPVAQRVLTEQGASPTDGAADAVTEATAAEIHPAAHVEIDPIELGRSAAPREESQRAFSDAEKRCTRLEGRLPDLQDLYLRSAGMATQSRDAVASSWRLLRELDWVGAPRRAREVPLPNAAMVIDPWEKARECDRAIETCTDARQRAIFAHLRNVWALLAADRSMGRGDWRALAESAQRLHVDAFHDRWHPEACGPAADKAIPETR
jgi:hypothetical protein